MKLPVAAYGSRSTRASDVRGKLSRKLVSSPRYPTRSLYQQSRCERIQAVVVRQCVRQRRDNSHCPKLPYRSTRCSHPLTLPLREIAHLRENAQCVSSRSRASSASTRDHQIHVPFLRYVTHQPRFGIVSNSKNFNHQYHVGRRFASSRSQPNRPGIPSRPRTPSRPVENSTTMNVRKSNGPSIKPISQQDEDRIREARLARAKLEEYVKRCAEVRLTFGKAEDNPLAKMSVSHIDAWRKEVIIRAKRHFPIARLSQNIEMMRGTIEDVVRSVISYTRHLINKFQDLLETIREQCKTQEKRWFTLFERILVAPILRKLDRMTNVNERIANGIDNVIKQRRMRRESIALATEEAEDLMRRMSVMDSKGKENENWELRKAIHMVSDFIFDTTMYAQRLQFAYQETRKGRTVSPWLAKLNDICQSLSTSRPTISEIGHQARRIYHNRELAKGNKDTTFAKRWATSMVAYYIWPVKASADEFEALVIPILRAFPNSRLEYLSMQYIKSSSSIIKAYSTVIGHGNVLICPHPNKHLQIHQILLMQPFDHYDALWKETRSLCNYLLRQMSRTDEEDATRISPLGALRRAKVVQAMDLFERASALDSSEALSRRAVYSLRSELVIWNSICVNHTARKPLATKAFQKFNRRIPGRTWKSDPYPTRHQRTARLATSWVEARDLYPSGKSITIDFVTSLYTLERAVEEISRQEVIGIDVTCERSAKDASKVRFITVATHKHVYVLDAISLHERGPQAFKDLLGSVLESPATLKIGVDYDTLSEIVFRDLSIDLQCFYDIAKVYSPSNGALAFQIMLKRHFGVSDNIARALSKTSENVFLNDPKSFFYNQALRAYGSLRLFHVLNQHDDVLTVDENTFNVATARKSVEKLQRAHLEFGPVKIDSQSDNQKALLFSLSHAMARQYLPRIAYSTEELRKGSVSKQNDKDIALQAIAAWVLATVFRESLEDIQMCLNLPEAAEWIIWANKTSPSLRLHQADLAIYQNAAANIEKERQGREAEEQPSDQNDYETLIKDYVMFTPMVLKNTSDPHKENTSHPSKKTSKKPARKAVLS